ncbi:MAG: folate-binding protein YgfZ [Sorangiineae bacterium]|nr:folate-binding protein YgfZ [Polyangiaceae bacterium]MEB2321364.1 folate-binding protein YgfZ [Sorangiineae bacterium]
MGSARANGGSAAGSVDTLVVEREGHGTIAVTGPDARAWLNGLVTCELGTLALGAGAWGLLLTKQGKIVTDFEVVVGASALFLSVAEPRRARLLEVLDRHLIMEDVELTDRSDELGWLVLHGARAAEVAREVALAHGAEAGAVDWTGRGGAAMVAPRASLSALLESLGARAVRRASPGEWEALRIECGVPEFGKDYDDGDKPHEASLERRAVAWGKGCYLGQEVVYMQDVRGRVRRRVSALALGGASPPARGASVIGPAGAEVGRVTSSAWSERLGQAVALAMMQTSALVPGAALTVDGAAARPLEPASSPAATRP